MERGEPSMKQRRRRQEQGQGLLEYLLIIGAVLATIIAFMNSGFKNALNADLDKAKDKLNTVGGEIVTNFTP